MSEIKSIVRWFETAKPEPTRKDAYVQIGCHYEEFSEMAAALLDYEESEIVHDASEEYKSSDGGLIDQFDKKRAVMILDSLCDQIVTAIGVAKFLGMDIEGALAEVNASNWSKFVDGKAVLDENGKIAKPDTYFKPNLEPFVGDLPWKK